MLPEVVRPDCVPSSARWLPDSQRWEQVPDAENGLPSGPFRSWRQDGSLAMQAFYEEGVFSGPFRRFHPDGSVAREGHYTQGHLQGVVHAYVNTDERAEPLRGCCVPTGAARMESRYEEGGLRDETFFDAEGYPLLCDGQRRPPRPDNVPAVARFDEHRRRWYHGARDDRTGSSLGTWNWWLEAGLLDEEVDHDDGHRVAIRRFNEHGKLIESTSLLRHDAFDPITHGPWRKQLLGVEIQAWGGPENTHEEAWLQGHFDGGQSVAEWTLKNSSGELLWTRILGHAVAESVATTSPTFVDRTHTKGHWLQVSDTLAAEGRMREFLVARARALAAGADVTDFVNDVAACVLPKFPAVRTAEARALWDSDERSVGKLVEALITGADTVEVLRALASTLPAWSCATRDLAEACVLLRPSDARCYLSRALVRFERADDVGLAADLIHLDNLDAAAFFHTDLTVFRPSYGFAPDAHSYAPLQEDIPLHVAQPLCEVLMVAQVYATRLLILREALASFDAVDRPWAPPLLPQLLPQGPVNLRDETRTIEDEDEQGQIEQTVVQIDETAGLHDPGVRAIIRQARADWAGLCWLLWAVGMNDVTAPTQVQPREAFPQALALVVERAWRARDQVVTSGLRSMTQGVAEFQWEGQLVSDLAASHLDVCVAEWTEARAVLLWLSNQGNLSPFQDDLRRI